MQLPWVQSPNQWGVYTLGKGFSQSGTLWTDGEEGAPNEEGRVIQMWYLTVNVTDNNGLPVYRASVRILASNGNELYNVETNTLGSINESFVLEGHRIMNDGTREDAGSYTLLVDKGLQKAENPVTMDQTKEITVVLGEVEKIEDTKLGLLEIVILLLIIVAILAGAAYYWMYVR